MASCAIADYLTTMGSWNRSPIRSKLLALYRVLSKLTLYNWISDILMGIYLLYYQISFVVKDMIFNSSNLEWFGEFMFYCQDGSPYGLGVGIGFLIYGGPE